MHTEVGVHCGESSVTQTKVPKLRFRSSHWECEYHLQIFLLHCSLRWWTHTTENPLLILRILFPAGWVKQTTCFILCPPNLFAAVLLKDSDVCPYSPKALESLCLQWIRTTTIKSYGAFIACKNNLKPAKCLLCSCHIWWMFFLTLFYIGRKKTIAQF